MSTRVVKALPTKNNKRKRIPIDQVESSSSSESESDSDEERETSSSIISAIPSAVPNGTGKAPTIPKTKDGLSKGKRLILFLDQAKLETIKTSHGYALLNCDDHRHLHKKYKRDPADSRPDVSKIFPAIFLFFHATLLLLFVVCECVLTYYFFSFNSFPWRRADLSPKSTGMFRQPSQQSRPASNLSSHFQKCSH